MDTTQIDIKTLEEAVTVFYRSGSQMQSAAHDWLTKAQLSPNAWSFVWELMQIEKVTEKPNFVVLVYQTIDVEWIFFYLIFSSSSAG